MHKLTHNPSDSYFVKGKKYHYNTFYIDSLGDTVVRGKLIIAPTGKPWIAQPGVQESVNYYHFVDSLEYVKFIDPEPFFAKRNIFPESLVVNHLTIKQVYYFPWFFQFSIFLV